MHQLALPLSYSARLPKRERAGIPRPWCSFLIIERLKGRFFDNTSETLDKEPK